MYQDLGKGVPKYRLRWRFDFANNKPSVRGMWNSAHSPAWSVNKEHLIRASIEGKEIATGRTITLAACDGHDFVNFKWHAFIKHMRNQTGNFPAIPIGLILQTRTLDVLYLADGSFGTKQRTEADKRYNYAGFGK